MLKKLNSRTFFIALVIIFSGVFLRLIKLSELFQFTYDEEVFAFVGKRIWVNHHIPLIGGVTPMHVHVAPYFYWFSALILFFSKLNPLGWGIAAAFISGLTMWVVYRLGKEIFGKKVAFVAVFLYAFSFYQNIFDRHYWGLTIDGLVSVLTILSLYKIIRRQTKYLIILALTLAIGIHSDLSTLTLILLTVLVFIHFKPTLPRLQLVLAGLIFLGSFAPLVIFDVRHNFVNSRGIFKYIEELKAGKKGVIQQSPISAFLFVPEALTRTIYVFGEGDLATQYAYCQKYAQSRLNAVPNLIAFGVLVLLGWTYIKLKPSSESERIGLKILAILFLSTYIGISLYGLIFMGDLFDHYLGTLFAPFLLTLSYILVHLLAKHKVFIISILLSFAFVNTYQLQTAHHAYGLGDKIKAVQWTIAVTGNTDFALDVLGDCFRYNGYRYLFYLFGKEPTKSYVDANFTYLFDNLPAQTYPPYLVVITNPDLTEDEKYYIEYRSYKEKLIASAQFGNIEVLIIDNRNLDFVGKF